MKAPIPLAVSTIKRNRMTRGPRPERPIGARAAPSKPGVSERTAVMSEVQVLAVPGYVVDPGTGAEIRSEPAGIVLPQVLREDVGFASVAHHVFNQVSDKDRLHRARLQAGREQSLLEQMDTQGAL